MSGMNGVYGNSIAMVGKSLDYLWQQQKVVRNNIANVDTPGYKAKYVSFEDTFREKLFAAAKSGDKGQMQRAITESRMQVQSAENESARLDGNNVNMDAEMVELTRSSLQYQYGISSVNNDIIRLKSAIKGQ